MNGIKENQKIQSSAQNARVLIGTDKEEKRKIAKAIYRAKYREKNREKRRIEQREYALKNPEKIKKYRDQYVIDNKDKIAKYKDDWYLRNRDRILAKQKEEYKKNPSILRERSKRYRDRPRVYNEQDLEKTKKCRTCGEVKEMLKFPKSKGYVSGFNNECKICSNRRSKILKENYKERRSELRKIQCRINIKYSISNKIRSSLWQTLKRNKIQKSDKTFSILEYTPEMLKKRLGKTLRELNRQGKTKYKWADFLKGDLHIDHIIPIAKFNYKSADDDDFKRCWSLDNLQLLPAKENLEKSAKCDNFQTSMFNFL